MYDVQLKAENAKQIVTHKGQAYVRVEKRAAGQSRLRVRRSLVRFERRKGNSLFPHIPRVSFQRDLFPSESLTGGRGHTITVDDKGQILSVQGASKLPYHLGNLSELIVPQLPPTPKWQTNKDVQLKIDMQRDPFIRLSPIRNRSSFRTYSARVGRDYQSNVEGDLLIVRCDHELATAEKRNNAPVLKLAGRGEWHFDLKRGVVRRAYFEYELLDQVDEREKPIKCKLILSIREVNVAEAKRRRLEAERKARAPLPVKESDKFAAQLLSKNRAHQLTALLRLRTCNPNASQPAIIKLIQPFLKSTDRTMRRAAQHAFVRWSTSADVKTLAGLLTENDVSRAKNKGRR